MTAPFSIVFTGVADQPVLATARLVAGAALHAGLDVACSEWPAPARGAGAVTATVRMGEEVWSPVVGEGEADVLVAFEEIEALRAAALLAKDGFAAVNRHVRPTWRMRAGLERPPEDVLSLLLARSPHVVGVRAEALARRVDGTALVGLILLGVVSPVLPVAETALQAALADGGADGLDARRQAVARGRKLYDALPSRIAAVRDRAG
jgi:indolepyruvate ferredoxin oxidoreductase beta subunit